MFSVIKCNCLINTGAENLNCLSIYKSEAVLYVYQACRTGNYFKKCISLYSESWKEFVFVVSLTYTGIIYCTSHILLS